MPSVYALIRGFWPCAWGTTSFIWDAVNLTPSRSNRWRHKPRRKRTTRRWKGKKKARGKVTPHKGSNIRSRLWLLVLIWIHSSDSNILILLKRIRSDVIHWVTSSVCYITPLDGNQLMCLSIISDSLHRFVHKLCVIIDQIKSYCLALKCLHIL